jgi:hypothetical protein
MCIVILSSSTCRHTQRYSVTQSNPLSTMPTTHAEAKGVRRRSQVAQQEHDAKDLSGHSSSTDDGLSSSAHQRSHTLFQHVSSPHLDIEPNHAGIPEEDDEDEENAYHFGDEQHQSGSGVGSGRPIEFQDYVKVMRKYPGYRYYFVSHLCQHIGDWFVRIASLLIVEELSTEKSEGSSLAHLTLSTLLPRAFFAQIGGILSDNFDRRKLMIIMDIMSGVVVLGYLLAIQYKSLSILYAVTTVRSAIGSAYYPVTTGMVPLLIPNVRDLQLAVTMNSWAWCSMAIVGGSIAGAATT